MSLAAPSPDVTQDEERPKKRPVTQSRARRCRTCPTRPRVFFLMTEARTCSFSESCSETILSKDSSVFETMFTLPPAQGNMAEGGCEGNPIILQDDTPKQFRSLLWVLHAMPHEIIEAEPTKHELPEFERLCDVVQIAHKYGFKRLETWALETFWRWVKPLPSSGKLHSHDTATLPCSSCRLHLKRMSRILELSILCESSSLHTIVEDHIHKEVDMPYADLPWFVATAEHFGINRIIGKAYYTLMNQGRDKWMVHARAGRLSHSQLCKLYNGFYGLTDMWQLMRATAPSIPPCAHQCDTRWEHYWTELMKAEVFMSRPAMVIRKLEIVLNHICTEKLPMEPECKEKAVIAVRQLLSKTRIGLVSHFVEFP